MGDRFHAEEETVTCHVCGGEMRAATSDLPLRLAHNRIAIFKNMPVLQCEQCGEYLLDDSVMARVEQMLESVDAFAELEVVGYAA